MDLSGEEGQGGEGNGEARGGGKEGVEGLLGEPEGGAEIDRGGGSRVQRRKLGACMR